MQWWRLTGKQKQKPASTDRRGTNSYFKTIEQFGPVRFNDVSRYILFPLIKFNITAQQNTQLLTRFVCVLGI